MPNIFLSHSSVDKERYVRRVAEKLEQKLDQHSIHYDEYTFESGMQSMEEIKKGLERTDLFVVFLSRSALNSKWVQKELLISRDLLGKEMIKRIFPVVIEEELEWKDPLIPEWLKDYTLKYISKPTKAVQLIMKRIIEITWDLNPKIKARDELFVGRNTQIEEFENRKYDYEKETVIAYIAAGIPKLGRRSLLKHCFSKANIIESQYKASDIELGMYDGIEDFIIYVNDLGFSDSINLKKFMKREIGDKCKVLAGLLDDIARNKEILLIDDQGCIITHDGQVCDWFIETLKLMKNKTRTVLGIASKFKTRLPVRTDLVYVIDIPPMSKMECGGLMQKYLEIDDIFLSRDDYKNYVGMMNGFPEQIKFACSLISKYGIQRAYDFSSEIESYESEIIGQLMRKLEESKEDMEFLRFLIELNMISYQTLQRIVLNDDLVKEKINKFYINGIIEFVGVSNEYIKIATAVKDYVTRAEYTLSEDYANKLDKYVSDFLNGYQYEELDMPDYLLKLKESLKVNGKIDNEYMIPSQYLKTMVELYEKQKDYAKVIEYADIVLKSTDYIEDKLVFEIRYFLCMALAKRRNRRMLSEVQKIKGADHNFLLGFYYRMIGSYDKALEELDKSLKIRRQFAKAKREKVQVLINLERFDEALDVAKENYENDKANPYHAHAYFLCLIKGEELEQNTDIINEVVDNLGKSTSDLGKELYVRCDALKVAYLERNLDMALAFIEKAVEESNNPIYSLQDKFDICEHLKAYDEMEKVIKEVESIKMQDVFGKDRSLFRMKALYAAYVNNKKEVSKIIGQIEDKGIRINLTALQKKIDNILKS